MKKTLLLTAAAVAACAFAACDRTSPSQARNLERAKATLDSVYASYGVADRCLLRENYPFNADYKAGYLPPKTRRVRIPIPTCGPSRERSRL